MAGGWRRLAVGIWPLVEVGGWRLVALTLTAPQPLCKRRGGAGASPGSGIGSLEAPGRPLPPLREGHGAVLRAGDAHVRVEAALHEGALLLAAGVRAHALLEGLDALVVLSDEVLPHVVARLLVAREDQGVGRLREGWAGIHRAVALAWGGGGLRAGECDWGRQKHKGGGGVLLCDTPCDIPSGRCLFTGPRTVTRSSLRMLRRVAAFCRPLRPVLLLVSFPRSRSPAVGVPGLCWMWRDVPFARQQRPIIGVLGVVLVVAPPPPLNYSYKCPWGWALGVAITAGSVCRWVLPCVRACAPFEEGDLHFGGGGGDPPVGVGAGGGAGWGGGHPLVNGGWGGTPPLGWGVVWGAGGGGEASACKWGGYPFVGVGGGWGGGFNEYRSCCPSDDVPIRALGWGALGGEGGYARNARLPKESHIARVVLWGTTAGGTKDAPPAPRAPPQKHVLPLQRPLPCGPPGGWGLHAFPPPLPRPCHTHAASRSPWDMPAFHGVFGIT